MKSEESQIGVEYSSVRRIAITIQYDGSGFCGWQIQKDLLTVQGVLEKAISDLDPFRPVKLVAAGRTDAGVHAAGQVAHFDSSGYIPHKRWASALNGRIPKTINIRESVNRPNDWHACHSAIYRRYRYTIYNGCKPNLFLSPWSWHKYRYRLDEELMEKALNGLIGSHDFSAFQRAGSNRSHSWTTIQQVQLERKGDLIVLDIQASGFLYGMVRLLVGQLVAIGEHRLTLSSFEKRWKECRRSEIREAAPPHGLCFIRAGYDDLIFSESASFDTFPRYSLHSTNSPIDPL